MATIRKRGCKWQVQVRRRGFPPASRTFLQQRDAERWGVMKEREFDLLESQGQVGAVVCELTVAELLDRYRREVVPTKRSASRETYMVSALERAPFASTKAAKLTARDVKRHRDARLQSVAPATVVRELGLLQHAYEVARRVWGFEGLPNPVKDVSKPSLPPGRSRRLTTDDVGKLELAAVKVRNPVLLPVMLFALETAMRLGEITSARWEHLDRANRVLLLPVTKNGKARTIPLSRKAMAVIEARPQQLEGLIFSTTTEAIKRAWRRLTARAGVVDLHFHDLRHEAISRLVERGFDLPSVMMFSGHSDHRMLLRYTHLNARKLVARLDESVPKQ